MALDVRRFSAVRPFLYHLTSRENLSRIRSDRRLFSSSVFLEKAGRPELRRTRRVEHLVVEFDGVEVFLRDQKPLHKGAMALARGINYEDFVELVNSLVFFWPGDEEQPVVQGRRHFERYKDEKPIVLRIPTRDVLSGTSVGRYSRHNSGAPRCSAGKRSPRGPSTFVTADKFDGTASKVVEVVFERSIRLTASAEVKPLGASRWRRL